MNLYFVLSETLIEIIWEEWFSNVGHEEPYRIADLVVADKPSQAKWLAWKADKASFTGDVRDFPKMSCRLRYKGIERVYLEDKGEPLVLTEPQVVTGFEAMAMFWEGVG